MKPSLLSGFRTAIVASLVLLAGLHADRAGAEEAYERFLAGLKEQGLFDMALEYLNDMRGSPLLSEAQKQQMSFDEGLVLVANARMENDAASKSKLLDQARDRFAEFIKNNPSNPNSANAELELGNVLVERGRSLLFQANRPSNATKKDALLKEGREVLEQAKKVFDEAEAKFSARSKEFKSFYDQKKEADKIVARDQVRGHLLTAQMLVAGVTQELAKSYAKGSAEYKKRMQEAAEKYKTLYEKHRRLLVGLMARLKEGECYQELGDTKRAIGHYETLLGQGDDLQLRPLKITALHLALQCLTSDNEKNYEGAVTRGDEWLDKALPSDSRTPDGLGITYYTALAGKLLADSLTKPEDQTRKKGLLVAAKKQAQFVAKAAVFNNPYRDDAQQLYRKLLGSEGGEQKEPENFVEALERAKELLDRQQDKLTAVKQAAELKDQANVPKYKTEAQQFGEQAIHYFKMALELRDDETPLDNVNIARYYLCYLDFQGGNYYDAAVLGEFVAKHYPKSQGGRQCAKIAMACWVQTYEAARKAKAKNNFDRDKMMEMADFITSAWPGGEEADEAWSLLLQIAISEEQIDKALEYLGKIPGDSPRRGDAELKSGQALWIAYQRAARRDAADRPPQAEIDKLHEAARKMLEDGIKRSRAAIQDGTAAVTLTTAAAALSLSNIDIEGGQAKKAIDLLNDAAIGPLTLVAKGDPIAKNGNFSIDTYKLALRAYVATQALEKAEATMESLEKLVNASGDTNAASQLTRIYIALGRELEQQLQVLRQEGKVEELNAVSKGFELFLDRISSRAKGNTFNSLNWVAETFFSLGSGYDAAGAKELSPEAKKFYEQTTKINEQILKQLAQDKEFGPEGAAPVVKLRTARTLRRLREFDKAKTMLVEILNEKANLLDGQVEAARTFQDWGAEKPEYFTKAIAGDVKAKGKDGRTENLLWGWAKIARRTQSQKKLGDTFYDALYNQAKCYLEIAKTKSGGDKTKMLDKADHNIKFTFRQDPQLGGVDWYEKFDKLLRVIQQLQGNARPTGLAELAATATPDTDPANVGSELAASTAAASPEPPPAAPKPTESTDPAPAATGGSPLVWIVLLLVVGAVVAVVVIKMNRAQKEAERKLRARREAQQFTNVLK